MQLRHILQLLEEGLLEGHGAQLPPGTPHVCSVPPTACGAVR